MELEDFTITAAALLGLISLFKNLLVFIRWLHATFLRQPKNLREYGSWAVVTGPTDGIGKALAFELASKGLNLVLVGRNPSKLEATSSELRWRYGNEIQVKTVVADLAKLSGLEIEAAVASATEGLDVGVVVNNAGAAQGHPFAKYFHEVDDESMESILRVNVNAVVWVTKGVIGGMLKKKRGAIVNIGSGSTVYVSSFPLQTLYASTKAFMAMFSKSVALEYKDQGIDIQCQVPLFTATKMTMLKKRPIFVPSAEMFSRASIRWIGYDRQCNPYWSHAVEGFVFHTLDTISVWYIERYMTWMRKKGLEQDRHL
ncbi:very-long-chain 3-oxoacyl-CoA reductase 1-like [Rhodamnia argentea]|uniref:Very-long-chain 3-oxoacyl-CoA reductase 1-like n=1 Tax=Rhodamnia argentea TaxID=178133 RepID=A0A8B8NXX7_9MYRT|nr:very-long-chain 3-oxoacyl-CoA reductase 1-like [Rhodamnia argentea]